MYVLANVNVCWLKLIPSTSRIARSVIGSICFLRLKLAVYGVAQLGLIRLITSDVVMQGNALTMLRHGRSKGDSFKRLAYALLMSRAVCRQFGSNSAWLSVR